MSFLSKIKDVGVSATVLSQLTGKSWELLDGEDNISYFFKANKQMHYVINGKTSVMQYEFIPNSKTLILFFMGIGGVSYHVKYVSDKALILKDEGDGIDYCFSNIGISNAPKNEEEAYALYFSKRMKYVASIYANGSRLFPERMLSGVDTGAEGLDNDDCIRFVDALIDHVYAFYYCYKEYLNHYSYNRSSCNSKVLNYYIKKTGDDIKYHKD